MTAVCRAASRLVSRQSCAPTNRMSAPGAMACEDSTSSACSSYQPLPPHSASSSTVAGSSLKNWLDFSGCAGSFRRAVLLGVRKQRRRVVRVDDGECDAVAVVALCDPRWTACTPTEAGLACIRRCRTAAGGVRRVQRRRVLGVGLLPRRYAEHGCGLRKPAGRCGLGVARRRLGSDCLRLDRELRRVDVLVDADCAGRPRPRSRSGSTGSWWRGGRCDRSPCTVPRPVDECLLNLLGGASGGHVQPGARDAAHREALAAQPGLGRVRPGRLVGRSGSPTARRSGSGGSEPSWGWTPCGRMLRRVPRGAP